MKTINCIYIVFLILIPRICFSQNENIGNDYLDAKIEMERNENTITLQPYVQNHSTLYFEYNYLLLVKKTDKNKNLSVNRQAGKFTIQPNESKKLSSISLNSNESQNITAILYIRDDEENKLITKDSIEIKNQNPDIVDEKSLLIQGIVINDTKTKLGNDFYDQFYSIYSQSPKKFDFIIAFTELPFRGTSSIIQTKVDNEIVYEFIANPNEEYNQQQAVRIMQMLNQYENSKTSLKYEFKY